MSIITSLVQNTNPSTHTQLIMKKLTFIILCLLTTISMAAQKPNQERKEFSPEKYRQNLEAFITKEVCLTPEEQQKFYPLLGEMMEAQRKLMDQEREIMRSGKDAKTEADFEKIISKSTALQVENRKLEQTYYKKFGKVLSWEKIYKVRIAMVRFNMQALRKFSPRKGKWNGPQKGKWDRNKKWPNKKN